MASTANNIYGTISRLRQCRDFQREPVRAILGRLRWKIRWVLTQAPCQLRIGNDIELRFPKTGSGGLLYAYGHSEPETIYFLLDYLQEGMVFWDVGAHIGEYALVASRKVGPTGQVEAFEPQLSILHFLSHNRVANNALNLNLHPLAVCERSGVVELSEHPDPARTFVKPATSALEKLHSATVDAISLDDFATSQNRLPNLIKVDVEGAEQFVLKGATTLLSLDAPLAPTWLVEFDAQNCTKFGYDPRLLIEIFRGFGYQTFWVGDGGRLQTSDIPQSFEFGSNLVAIKSH